MTIGKFHINCGIFWLAFLIVKKMNLAISFFKKTAVLKKKNTLDLEMACWVSLAG